MHVTLTKMLNSIQWRKRVTNVQCLMLARRARHYNCMHTIDRNHEQVTRVVIGPWYLRRACQVEPKPHTSSSGSSRYTVTNVNNLDDLDKRITHSRLASDQQIDE